MKKFKKLLALVLISVFAVPVINISAENSVNYVVDGVEMTIGVKNDGVWFFGLDDDENTAEICAYRGEETDLKIPEKVEYEGKEYIVTSMDLNCECFEYESSPTGFPKFNVQNSKIESLTIPKTVEKLYSSQSACLMGERGGAVVIDGKLIAEYTDFSDLYNLKEIIVDPENKYFSSKDGVLFDKKQTVLIRYPRGKSDKSYMVPKTVEKIIDDAFCAASLCEEIIITENVKELGEIFEYIHYSKIVFLNNILGKKELKKSKLRMGEITVYKDSPAHKYFKNLTTSWPFKLNVIDNPYIKETKSKKKTTEKVKEKDTSKVESVSEIVSSEEVPTESSITPIETPEVAKTENTKPKKTAIVVGIVASAVLVGGISIYFILKRKRKSRV